jgi:hypothetical protein
MILGEKYLTMLDMKRDDTALTNYNYKYGTAFKSSDERSPFSKCQPGAPRLAAGS